MTGKSLTTSGALSLSAPEIVFTSVLTGASSGFIPIDALVKLDVS